MYRETIVSSARSDAPVVLVVAFKLRRVRGWGHVLFRAESLLNTPLFVGFPGFVSKLWLAHDNHGVYRGFYQWHDPQLADAYVRALWWVLTLVSVRGSIRYVVLPGLRRDDVLAKPALLDTLMAEEPGAWWRLRSVHTTRPVKRDPVEVLVVGAGTTGLALALQAVDHGATVRVVEQRPDAIPVLPGTHRASLDPGGLAVSRRHRHTRRSRRRHATSRPSPLIASDERNVDTNTKLRTAGIEVLDQSLAANSAAAAAAALHELPTATRIPV